MKIGIIGAMEQEITLLRDKLANLTTHHEGGCTFYSGTLQGRDVVLLQSGIGKVSAAVGTTLLLSQFKPDCVINTGSAGAFEPSLNLGDVVISSQVCYHDADATAFGYQMGQVPQQPAHFDSDDALMALAEKAIDDETHVVRGLICTADTFVHTDAHRQHIRTYFPKAVAAEMEAAAIAQVCAQFKIPFVVVRAISDVVAEKESPMTFEEFLPLAAKSSSAMVEKMVALFD
ncbi:5'-methylthioadenosine/S-adenosylhomocysteine nucleosidase [Salinivibrio sp. IB872]|uniref:5'-methylthioadenosine/S-adenosylhomocysteine nucleosidase n=1 Tax=Salinivibrio sp. IB872 TaxID=1766123 RepID=UPI000986CBBA|nr:5'-methylthioadenosine/S-adenosylhomocysteine nucleosidase [Salinivibrio sp. IB872]OOF28814.1 5'-methylthioadenosine/S-adenosylhomocysteine nucleosidase [Salinivibrio sp. IB872]